MRIHISLDDRLVRELDRRVGKRGRSPFIAKTVRRALDDAARWDSIESAIGSIAETGHEWDEDPGRWVRRGRRGDSRRTG